MGGQSEPITDERSIRWLLIMAGGDCTGHMPTHTPQSILYAPIDSLIGIGLWHHQPKVKGGGHQARD